MSETFINIGVGVIVFIALGVLVWLAWPSKIDLDEMDEHARNPFRW